MPEITRVYVGLPQYLHSKVFWVETNRRTNPLSHTPGGSDVIVLYSDGRKPLGYDRVKFVKPYLNKFVPDMNLVIEVYARRYLNDDQSKGSFESLWKTGDAISLEAALDEYDDRWRPKPRDDYYAEIEAEMYAAAREVPDGYESWDHFWSVN